MSDDIITAKLKAAQDLLARFPDCLTRKACIDVDIDANATEVNVSIDVLTTKGFALASIDFTTWPEAYYAIAERNKPVDTGRLDLTDEAAVNELVRKLESAANNERGRV